MAEPLIFYIDDEPRNLAVFEATLPSNWRIQTFDDPRRAVAALGEGEAPWVIVSDQRMPGMTGVEVLEVARAKAPLAVRMIVTGYSDEDLVVESVRKAQIFDYIRKPWDAEDLEKSIFKAIQHYTLSVERQRLFEELKSWVSPLALWAAENKDFTFPIKKDLVGITFDLKDSSELHSLDIKGTPLRSRILQAFGESVLKQGGWTEGYSGDSGYANYGLMGLEQPYLAALNSAREFRASLQQMGVEIGKSISCGIALHPARNSIVDLRIARVTSPRGAVIQKAFDTSSLDIDRLHRIEKLAHCSDGIHLLASGQFKDGLEKETGATAIDFTTVGSFVFKGSLETFEVFYVKDVEKNTAIPDVFFDLPGSNGLKKAA